jgi:hypothetical protein
MASKVYFTRSMSIALAFPTFWNLLSNSWNRSSENIKWFYLANQDYFQLLPDSCMTLHVLSRSKMYYFICSVFLELQDNVPGYSWSYQCEILQYQFIYNSSGIAKLKHTLMVLKSLFFFNISSLYLHFTNMKKFCARPWFDDSNWQWN